MASVQYVPSPFINVLAQNRSLHGGHHPLGVTRKFAQGAGSALLIFAGADSLASNAGAAQAGVTPIMDFSSIEGIVQSFVAGGLTGPMQILVAALLFLAAGRCVARFVGLITVTVVLLLYLQGVTLQDAWAFLQGLAQRSSAAVTAFQHGEVV